MPNPETLAAAESYRPFRFKLPSGSALEVAESPIIVWFRRDLRLADNPALEHAARAGSPIVPLFIWSPGEESHWQPGAASRWWLHHSLDALSASLGKRGSRLILKSGPTLEVLEGLVRETGAASVYWNRLYEPAIVARDTALKELLKQRSITARSFNASLLFEPETIQNNAGSPYKVFTQFWRKCLSGEPPALPEGAPRELPAPPKWPASNPVESLGLLPKIKWDVGLRSSWTPGEAAAKRSVKLFLDASIAGYPTERDRPDTQGTSRLSPHLHFGEIGPRQVWHAAEAIEKEGGSTSRAGITKFLAEMGWREFAHHLLFHFPNTTTEPLRSEFARFPWRRDAAGLRAWQSGETGYPIVDAGMRELWHTGWMHNRVRMIVASFLVKDLLLPWQDGAKWFWDTLVDADLAANTLGWQWAGGCGADAAPYFRVFNPVLQGEKFDPKGIYVRKWCPELTKAPDKYIHKPFALSPGERRTLCPDYPQPVVDHAMARERALEAFQTLKRG